MKTTPTPIQRNVSAHLPKCGVLLTASTLAILFALPVASVGAQAVRPQDTVTTSTTTVAVPTTAQVTTGVRASSVAVTPADEEVVHMSPFEVHAKPDEGYIGATTLAGNRLNTDVRDIGNGVQVITARFMQDIAATGNSTLLQYTTNTEVGGIYGNFAGVGDGPQLNESLARPNENTRIRGLAMADNTRDYFRSEIPWDSYNTDRVDLQRGPNSIIFGQGSPAGIINASTAGASFHDANKAEIRVGSYGSVRGVLDINKAIIPDQIALRVQALGDTEKYSQQPAFNTDKRLTGSIRVEPKFLQIGGARTILKANFESGNVNSNNPRELPPGDLITPWFKNGTYAGRDNNGNPVNYAYPNKGTYNGYQLWDNLTGRSNSGQEYKVLASGQINSAYQPYIGYMAGIQDNPVAFNAGNGSTALWITEATKLPGGLAPDGTLDGTIDAMPMNRIGGITTTSQWAINAKLPFYDLGLYKNKVLTDPSVFDFYNKLIDGDTKREWQKFNQANVSLAQTFFHDMFGIEGSYHHENYKAGQTSLFDGANNAIGVDIMQNFSDGTPAGANGVQYANGTPNPNVGRAYIASNGQTGNYEWNSEREAYRGTAFVTYDFTKKSKSWWARVLGEETLTGFLADDKQNTDNRAWQSYGMVDTTYQKFIGASGLKFNDVNLTPSVVAYIGPSLSDRSSASGANLPYLQYMPVLPSGIYRAFNSTWNATGVSPGAYWANPLYQPGQTGYDSTQSENPANYVGWTGLPLTITNAASSRANRDLLTTDAALNKNETTSQGLVWQGKLLDKSVIVTYGWRKDIAKAWSLDRNVSTSTAPLGILDLGPSYTLSGAPLVNRNEVQSHAYSIMAHISDLPFVAQFAKKLPIDISFYYNHSTNFKPDASRVDVYGVPLPPPSGKTIDRGILLETRDRKYSLKINYYVTSVKNETGTGFGGLTWFLGDAQAWGANFTNVYQYNIGNGAWTVDPANINQGSPLRYDYYATDGVTPQPGLEAKAIAGWRAWQASVDPRFYRAWSINTGNFTNPQAQVTSAIPQGFTVPEDSLSKGWEFEFNAEPLHNWRIMVNASQVKATRSNIGGENLNNFINAYEKALDGDAGTLRLWWGTADVPTSKDYWYSLIGNGGSWALQKLSEGTSAPEVREWRVNVITNYGFDHGPVKGLNVGGGMRYQSSVGIGYPPDENSTVDNIGYNFNSPFKGPSETNFDLWVGYTTKLTKGITWHIQLNVANLFKGKSLIPITAQPDGTPAGYRIAPSQTWSLTNTFEF